MEKPFLVNKQEARYGGSKQGPVRIGRRFHLFGALGSFLEILYSQGINRRIMKFSELNLDERLLKAIEEAGFTECFPVQEETFRRTLQGRDVTVQSQTGSGKTAAFLITIFQHLIGTEKFKGKKALVIVPTRELATQIEEDAEKLVKYLPLKIGSFYGGIGYAKQEELLRDGVDVIIGTPGRLIDFSKQKKMDLSKVGILVIDEADRLFDMGFLPDLRKLLRKMPPAEERLSMLLSATLSLRVGTLSWEYMNGAEEIQITPENVTVETITQRLYHVSSVEKLRLLIGLLEREKPKNAIIFTNTKHTAEELSKRLALNGYKSQFIIGDLPQKKRLRVIDDFKEGLVSFLVATDVAARGLHVEDLDMVVNYDVPEDSENYVHRIGRTARVGKSGKAVMLACEKFVFGLEAIEKFIGIKIPVESFDESMFGVDKSAGMRIYTERYGRREYGDDDRRGPGRGRGPARRPSRGDEPRRPPRVEDRRRFAEEPSRLSEEPRKRIEKIAAKPAGIFQEKPKIQEPVRKDIRPNPIKKGTGHKMSQEERVAFYKEKYGENFQPGEGSRRGHGRNRRPNEGSPRPSADRPKPSAPPGTTAPSGNAGNSAPSEKPTLIKKILGFFTGKKS
jgi:ATP-dependent RNA helicase RhlB